MSGSKLNSLVVTLSHYCLISGRTCASAVHQSLLAELARSVADDINVDQPLSADLVNVHQEAESELFFQVAFGDEASQALKPVARRRILTRWSDREL